MKYSLGIVGLGRDRHARCFLDQARALANALRRLGHEVDYTENALDPRGRLIIFGGGNLLDVADLVPKDAILFNAEQLAAVDNPGYFLQNYVKLKSMTVWDYSAANVEVLRNRLGVSNAVFCPVGYVPEMTKAWAKEHVKQDIDVLHYGTIGRRRRKILDAMDDAGIDVARVFDVYDIDRDLLIARSKIVLNIHHYPNGVFEIFRCSHLYANRKCVVSEKGGCDEELEKVAEDCGVHVPLERMIDECRRLLADENARREQEECALTSFAQFDLVEAVRMALEQS